MTAFGTESRHAAHVLQRPRLGVESMHVAEKVSDLLLLCFELQPEE